MTSKAFQNAELLAGVSVEADPGENGYWPNVDTDAKIVRLRDRLFVGGGAAFTGGFTATQGGFVNASTDGAQWAPRDSALFAAQDIGLMVITAFASNENMDLTGGQPSETIALSGFTINAQATRTTWAGYLDIQHEAGVASYGMEIAAKNKSTDKTDTSYATAGGVYGIWFAGGGDTAYGGTWTNPSNTAIKIGKNDPVGTTWNKGIVFVHNGLTGSDGTTGEATAIEMGYGQKIAWLGPSAVAGFNINCQVSSASSSTSLLAQDNVVRFKGHSGEFLTEFAHQASAVNYLQIINRATGSGPRLTAKGETNVDLELSGSGSGVIRFGTHSALAAETVSGYITIKDINGNVRKLAVVS